MAAEVPAVGKPQRRVPRHPFPQAVGGERAALVFQRQLRRTPLRHHVDALRPIRDGHLQRRLPARRLNQVAQNQLALQVRRTLRLPGRTRRPAMRKVRGDLRPIADEQARAATRTKDCRTGGLQLRRLHVTQKFQSRPRGR